MTALTAIRTAAEATLIERLDTAAEADPTRARASAAFATSGLPHRRVEAYRYTDLRAMLREAAPMARDASQIDQASLTIRGHALSGLGFKRYVVVNGRFQPGLSSVWSELPGVTAMSLKAARAADHPACAHLGAVAGETSDPIVALAGGLAEDGVLIHVAKDAVIEGPLQIAFIHLTRQPHFVASRALVVVEAGASVTLVETHEGPDGVATQADTLVEIVVGDGAKVEHVRLNAEGAAALALSTLAASIGAGADFQTLNLVAGSATARHQIFLRCAGDHATFAARAASMLSGRQHADHTLVVDHAEPHGISRELFRHVVDDEATGVFQGKITVRQKAQKTDGRMMSGALLLSDGATMFNKPELEIFADDVACAHGATCGALDDNQLFYLMSRGLPRREAESLLLHAFLAETLETVSHQGLREALDGMIAAWLARRAAA